MVEQTLTNWGGLGREFRGDTECVDRPENVTGAEGTPRRRGTWGGGAE